MSHESSLTPPPPSPSRAGWWLRLVGGQLFALLFSLGVGGVGGVYAAIVFVSDCYERGRHCETIESCLLCFFYAMGGLPMAVLAAVEAWLFVTALQHVKPEARRYPWLYWGGMALALVGFWLFALHIGLRLSPQM